MLLVKISMKQHRVFVVILFVIIVQVCFIVAIVIFGFLLRVDVNE